jgi:hypothetical protein
VSALPIAALQLVLPAAVRSPPHVLPALHPALLPAALPLVPPAPPPLLLALHTAQHWQQHRHGHSQHVDSPRLQQAWLEGHRSHCCPVPRLAAPCKRQTQAWL